jgi:hypothetical protein
MTVNLLSIALRIRTAWLRHRVNAYSRMLHAIAIQRKNDFEAERLLHRQMSRAHSELLLLGHDPRVANQNGIAARRQEFRPRIIQLVQKE